MPLIEPINEAPMCFTDAGKESSHPGVYAELEVLNSAFCIPISTCHGFTDHEARCPLTGQLLRSGEPVYIERATESLILSGQKVMCFDAFTLRGMSMSFQGQKMIYGDFRNPLNPEDPQTYNLNRDFQLYFIFDEKHLETGICQRKNSPTAKKKRRGGKGKTKKASTSALPTP